MTINHFLLHVLGVAVFAAAFAGVGHLIMNPVEASSLGNPGTYELVRNGG